MIIGILSDAHGNIYGLKECFYLLLTLKAKEIFFLGDAIDYFSQSKEVLSFLKKNKITCIKGNHEMILLNDKKVSPEAKKVYNIEHTKNILTQEDYDFINTWDDHIELKKHKILMVHASPFDYFEEYVYPNSDFSKFKDLDYDMVLMGHSHIPFIKEVDKKIIANVGSVGFCRDDGRFLSCALVDTDQKQIQILKKDFPSKKLEFLGPFHQDIGRVLQRTGAGDDQ